jgi:hypothetical protein
VIFGWALFVIGAVGLIWPRVFITVAPYYRAMMPSEISSTTIRSARIGGALAAAAGLAVALTA